MPVPPDPAPPVLPPLSLPRYLLHRSPPEGRQKDEGNIRRRKSARVPINSVYKGRQGAYLMTPKYELTIGGLKWKKRGSTINLGNGRLDSKEKRKQSLTVEDLEDLCGEASALKCVSRPSEKSLRLEIFNLRAFKLPEVGCPPTSIPGQTNSSGMGRQITILMNELITVNE